MIVVFTHAFKVTKIVCMDPLPSCRIVNQEPGRAQENALMSLSHYFISSKTEMCISKVDKIEINIIFFFVCFVCLFVLVFVFVFYKIYILPELKIQFSLFKVTWKAGFLGEAVQKLKI